MYSKYAEEKKWDVQIAHIRTELGGLKSGRPDLWVKGLFVFEV